MTAFMVQTCHCPCMTVLSYEQKLMIDGVIPIATGDKFVHEFVNNL